MARRRHGVERQSSMAAGRLSKCVVDSCTVVREDTMTAAGERNVEGLSEGQQPLTGANTDSMEINWANSLFSRYSFYDINLRL
jgi:hypothetical protein